MTKRFGGIVGWLAVATMCAVYAPMAIEYMWRFFDPSAPALWDRTYSGVVGDRIVFGSGSIYNDQHEAYMASRVILLVHTIFGGTAILIGAMQFSSRLRQRFTVIHRISGRVQVPVVAVVAITGMIYLVRTGPDRTFTGPAFYVQLWMIAIGTLVSIVLATVAIVRGQVAVHRSFMALNFALLLTAPLLRLSYLVLGLAWPDQTQTVANMAASAILGVWIVAGAIVATRIADRGHRPPYVQPTRIPRSLWWSTIAINGAAGAGVILAYLNLIGSPDRIMLSYMVTLAVTVSAFAILARRAAAAQDSVAAGEWRIHLLALCWSPATFVLLWPLFSPLFGVAMATYCAMFLASAIPMSLGFMWVSLRRWQPRSAPPRPAAPTSDPGVTPVAVLRSEPSATQRV